LAQRRHSREHLLLGLNHQDVRPQYSLDRAGNLTGRKTVGALQHPDRLGHHHDTDETRIPLGQTPLDQFGRPR
jgi:hypothetical protein